MASGGGTYRDWEKTTTPALFGLCPACDSCPKWLFLLFLVVGDISFIAFYVFHFPLAFHLPLFLLSVHPPGWSILLVLFRLLSHNTSVQGLFLSLPRIGAWLNLHLLPCLQCPLGLEEEIAWDVSGVSTRKAFITMSSG